jgi:hypothetical protein
LLKQTARRDRNRVNYLQQENPGQLKKSISNEAMMSQKGYEKNVWPVPVALFLDWKQNENLESSETELLISGLVNRAT